MNGQNNLSPELRDIWTDAFRFHATFEQMGNSLPEWQKCTETMVALVNRRGGHPLAEKLMMAVMDYLSDSRKAIAKAEAEGQVEQIGIRDVMRSG